MCWDFESKTRTNLRGIIIWIQSSFHLEYFTKFSEFKSDNCVKNISEILVEDSWPLYGHKAWQVCTVSTKHALLLPPPYVSRNFPFIIYSNRFGTSCQFSRLSWIHGIIFNDLLSHHPLSYPPCHLHTPFVLSIVCDVSVLPYNTSCPYPTCICILISSRIPSKLWIKAPIFI